MAKEITFDADDYEEIRKAIDVTMSSGMVSDTVISMSIYEGAAIETIITALASITDQEFADNQSSADRAAKLLTAAYIAPTVPSITSETLEGDQMSYEKRDFKLLAKTLEDRAYVIVNNILNLVNAEPISSDSSFAAGLFSTAKACPK